MQRSGGPGRTRVLSGFGDVGVAAKNTGLNQILSFSFTDAVLSAVPLGVALFMRFTRPASLGPGALFTDLLVVYMVRNTAGHRGPAPRG